MRHIHAWLLVIAGGLFKWPAKILAPFAYPFIDKRTNPVWGLRDSEDLGYWNVAFRNGAHNFFNKPRVDYTTRGSNDAQMELSGFKWRYRMSINEAYVSYRITWGKARSKGKREFYIGWTMSQESRMRLTFFQLRPF